MRRELGRSGRSLGRDGFIGENGFGLEVQPHQAARAKAARRVFREGGAALGAILRCAHT